MYHPLRHRSVSIRTLLGLGVLVFLVVFFGLTLTFSHFATDRSLEFHMRAVWSASSGFLEVVPIIRGDLNSINAEP